MLVHASDEELDWVAKFQIEGIYWQKGTYFASFVIDKMNFQRDQFSFFFGLQPCAWNESQENRQVNSTKPKKKKKILCEYLQFWLLYYWFNISLKADSSKKRREYDSKCMEWWIMTGENKKENMLNRFSRCPTT